MDVISSIYLAMSIRHGYLGINKFKPSNLQFIEWKCGVAISVRFWYYKQIYDSIREQHRHSLLWIISSFFRLLVQQCICIYLCQTTLTVSPRSSILIACSHRIDGRLARATPESSRRNWHRIRALPWPARRRHVRCHPSTQYTAQTGLLFFWAWRRQGSRKGATLSHLQLFTFHLKLTPCHVLTFWNLCKFALTACCLQMCTLTPLLHSCSFCFLAHSHRTKHAPSSLSLTQPHTYKHTHTLTHSLTHSHRTKHAHSFHIATTMTPLARSSTPPPNKSVVTFATITPPDCLSPV